MWTFRDFTGCGLKGVWICDVDGDDVEGVRGRGGDGVESQRSL